MNTTAAAEQAKVTVRTIRKWCRRGVVTATKHAGRWDIAPASLNRRIQIGAMRARKATMTDQPTYTIEEREIVHYGSTRTAYFIVRTDGTPIGYGKGNDSRPGKDPYFKRETAQFYCEFYNRTPAGYRVSLEHPRSSSINRTPYWLLTGGTNEDPKGLRTTLPTTWTQEGTLWPEGTRPVDVLVKWVHDHAAGAPERIAKKAEADAVAAAEAAVREAREAQLAEIRAKKGTLATPRQVEYILRLLAARERTGDGGGFFNGPTDRAGIEELSKGEASLYIDSLKGNY